MATNISKIALPSLSSDGWVFSSNKQADYIMSHFLASDYSQSYVHSQWISSFGWIVAQYNNQPELLVIEAKRALEQLFIRYFNGVSVETRDATDPSEPSQFILGLYVEFQTADGTTSNIYQLTKINGSKFQLMNRIINDGNG